MLNGLGCVCSFFLQNPHPKLHIEMIYSCTSNHACPKSDYWFNVGVTAK